MSQDDDEMDWTVLINDEEQHSLWPATNPVPAGWRAVTPPGPRDAALSYVDAHWTDMRPLSLRH